MTENRKKAIEYIETEFHKTKWNYIRDIDIKRETGCTSEDIEELQKKGFISVGNGMNHKIISLVI